MTDILFELIQLSLGNKNNLSRILSEEEWLMLFDMVNKQSLTSVLFVGLEKIFADGQGQKPKVLFQWFAIQQKATINNQLHNIRAKRLTDILKIGRFESCILKGQGTALYYDYPDYRQCGDIDVWVRVKGMENDEWNPDQSRDDILNFARKQMLQIGHVDIKHSDITFFSDVPVEVHFLPSWMYNPFTNKKLQSFFKEQTDIQFSNYDSSLGFAHTTIEFDLVYSIVHIYRHIFSEGIGLRQLMDYYYILLRSSKEQRDVAFDILTTLKMKSFVGGIMWILNEKFGMKKELLLCPTNLKHGEFLLSEILTAGNFGHYDERMLRIDKDKRFERGFVQLKRNLRFVGYYPSEVLWSPFWKLWHWCWRKQKGYL